MRTAIALAALALGAAVYAQVDPARVIVKVNGAPITGKDYYSRMESQPGLGTPTNDGKFVQIYPGYLTMRFLIEEELMVQLAKSQGVAPTDAEIDAELKYRIDEDKATYTKAVQAGATEADFKRHILVELSQFKVLTKGINVTDFEVEKFYKDNTVKFTIPKRYELRMIRVGSAEDKTKVDEALAKGEKFADVASRLSNDVSRLDGGRIGLFTDEDMVPATRTIVAGTAKGKATGWLEQNGLYAKFYIEDIKQLEIIPLDAKLKKMIREQIMEERGGAKNNVPAMMQEFRKQAKLEFGNYPFATEIKRYFELGG